MSLSLNNAESEWLPLKKKKKKKKVTVIHTTPVDESMSSEVK